MIFWRSNCRTQGVAALPVTRKYGYPVKLRIPGTYISGNIGTYICGNTGMGAPIFPEIWVRGIPIFP